MTTTDTGAPRMEIEIDAVLDRQAAEMLQLEIRRLAQQHGLDTAAVRIEATRDPGP